MKKVIMRISLVLFSLLASISYADEKIVPKDVSQALELEYKEQLSNAEKFKHAASKALKSPIGPSSSIQTKRHAVKYVCERTTGGTWIEQYGVECRRCAWYRQIGNCTFEPGDECQSERITEFTYTCVYAPDKNAPK